MKMLIRFRKCLSVVFFLFTVFSVSSLSATDSNESYQKGLQSLSSGNYAAAVEYLGLAATDQHAEAQSTLGVMFRSGIATVSYTPMTLPTLYSV